MDTPTQRMLKIGKATIGLIGLDIALNKALAEKISVKNASNYLYDAIRGENYIPAGMKEEYKKALEREYKKLLGQEVEDDGDLIIRIFGTGCISCNGLQDAVIDAMMQADIAADIDMIHEPDEIGRHGITATPALMINGKVKIAGIHPTPVQLKQWLLEAAEKQHD
ncbi:MAG TPA: thioredoxin family protein [Desulfobacterales bacterium]|nr:thioredoxin family protein [Desulfobacterales bacterium]HIP39234.1 thioredoxin family protein [Desulfocapsa sulfexigens]